MAVFAGQFVPLKIETAGATWGKWASKYRPQGNGIPIIYVIRADGEMLYGKSGSLRGKDLLNLITGSLQKSGRSFNNEQFQALTTLVNQLKSGLANDDLAIALQTLKPLSNFGELGNLQSYASVAIEADDLVKQVAKKTEEAISNNVEKLEDDQTAFAAIVELVSLKHQISPLQHLKPKLEAAIDKVSQNEKLKGFLLPAESLARGARYESLNTKTGTKQAVTTYTRVVEQHNGTPAEKIARQRLAKLNASAPESPAGDGEYRVWMDATGKFKIEAKLLDYTNGQVRLQRRDGKIISLPDSQLSQEDRALLELEL